MPKRFTKFKSTATRKLLKSFENSDVQEGTTRKLAKHNWNVIRKAIRNKGVAIVTNGTWSTPLELVEIK